MTAVSADPSAAPETLRVDLGDRSYDILVGAGLLGGAGRLMAPVLRQKRVFIVTDETVAGLHLGTLTAALDAAGIRHDAYIIAPGEASKSYATFERLLNAMLEARCERATTVVALGGGVVGDLAGFAAAALLRGVDFVQVPTTLLSQVDSSVGGKTGINTPFGKNLVGAFHQPRLVLIDTDTLGTLDRRELLAGYAEVVKYGLIDDPAFFERLERDGTALIAGDEAQRRAAILTSCAAKARVVAEDEREGGRRALLNLGHTFGHALEAECGYGGTLLHGEAVAIGMVMAFDLSARLDLCPAEDAARVRAHLAAVGLPVTPPRLEGARLDTDRLIAHMASDKKVAEGKVTFVLARGIGQAFLTRDVAPEALRATVAEAVAAS
ncbi:3-dehydroquinate synthase [Caenispirillum salinarum AK4]|uniref:3-dehydroquinate synthase n=1 Tax=Caenispirillum salinarum AK4 TaxID=1238182 RepID=K9GLL1_9PROT|nr:3-dehydroquinate synthase [Caenispirillum salinarum]EKV26900.1 3-dehydroquinate synthase [Caenispirillum salinarum AK4]